MFDGCFWLGMYKSGVDIFDVGGVCVGVLWFDCSWFLMVLLVDIVLMMVLVFNGGLFIGMKCGFYWFDVVGWCVEWVVLVGWDLVVLVWVLLVDGDDLWVGG